MSSNVSEDDVHGGWTNTVLAGLANYIDGGSIVAGAAALTLWAERYHLSVRFLGLVGAFSANAIAAGVGALLGGYLCDRFGRTRIYQYDMLFYAFGMAWLVGAMNPAMIVIGFVLVGLAVGADIPASWSLIAESAPQRRRGAHCGVAQMLWFLGPLIVTVLFLVLAPFGLLGARIVFAHLLVLALLLTLLRSRMRESPLWTLTHKGSGAGGRPSVLGVGQRHQLLTLRNVRAMAFLIGMYGIWNLCNGTLGFFLPYILRTVGGETQVTAMTLQAGVIVMSIASLALFVRFADHVNQRRLLGLSVFMQAAAISLFAIFPLTVPLVLTYYALSAVSVFGSPQAFYQLWSAELFPTALRGTAQGITFAAVRIGLGLWSFFVPLLASSRFTTLIWVLVGFVVMGGVIGVIGGPRNAGKSLREIEAETDARVANERVKITRAPL